jgi:hypothetical protein
MTLIDASMRLFRRMVPAAVAAFLLAACGSRSTSPHRFEVVEEEGVPTAVTSGGPRFGGSVFDLSFVCRLEQDESRPETLLSGQGWALSHVLMDEAGRIYASDQGNHLIHVFNPDGSYRFAIGREGQGPGEFTWPRVVTVGGGELSVFSGMVGSYRLSFFRTDGTLIRVRMLRRAAMNTREVFPAGGDRTVHVANDYTFDAGIPIPVRRIAVMSAEDDTVAVVEQRLEELVPFQGQSFSRYVPGRGILARDGREPVLNWYDLEGRLLRRVRLDVPRTPVTDEERRAIRTAAQHRLEEATDERTRRSLRQRAEQPVPEVKDYWSDVLVDEAGFIWAQEPYDYWTFDLAAIRFRIFNPEGEYLGDQYLPDFEGDSGVFDLSREYLILRYLAADVGAPVVEVYRIRSAVPGLVYP